jgi:iron-sulfur cluster assembly protein
MALLENTEQVTLTAPAAAAVTDLLEKRSLQGYALRVYIAGGGCSGFQYGMALEGNARPEDVVFEHFGVKLVVDEVSINYLRGATIDYVEDVMASGFKIINPNAVSTCGCGNSFRTENDGEPGSESGCGGSCGCS